MTNGVTSAGLGWRAAAVAAATAVGCGAAGWLDRGLLRRYEGVPPITTVGGVLLALLLMNASRRWIVAGVALVVAAGGAWLTDAPLLQATRSAAILVIVALLAALLLQRMFGARLRIDRLDEVLALLAFAAVAGGALAAIASAALTDASANGLVGAFRERWLAEGLGVLVVTPLLLAAAAVDWRAAGRTLRSPRLMEALLVFFGIVWTTHHVFTIDAPTSHPSFVARYGALALLLWAALRLSPFGGALGVALLGVCALKLGPGNDTLLSLQLFLVIAAVQTHVAGAVAAERAAMGRVVAETAARYRSQIEHAPEAIVVMDVGTGRFVDHNPAAERLFGLSARELAEVGPVELSPPKQPDGRPSKEAARAWIEQALAGGMPVFEWTHRNKRGRDIACEVRLLELPSSRGRLMRGSITDITERKRAEVALRRSEANLRVAQRVGGVGSWHVDVPNYTLEWSEECYRIFGRDPKTFRPTNEAFFESVHPDDRAAVQAASKRSLGTGEPYGIEHRIVLPDGTERHVLENAEIERDASGRIVAMVGTTQDITERKQLQQQLLQSQKLESVGRLAGGVAHDFNNLLTVIRGGAELLLARLKEDDPARADVQEIEMAARRASDLTRQLLSFARRQIVEPKLLDLAELAADMEKLLQRVLGEDVELTLRAAPDLWSVKADRSQLEQVVMNLAVNARDAMPGGGRLSIEVDNVVLDGEQARLHPDVSPGPHVRFTMTDTGVGMGPPTLAHLFEPFFTTKEVGKGTGLGLATVHGIVKQAGGAVAVKSEPGRGTAFTIWLPSAKGEREAVAASEGGVLPRGQESILLVEDDRQLREMVTRALGSCGYEVVAVADGERAGTAAVAAPRPFDLLITDMVLPRTSGREIAAKLRALWPSLKVLCITGYTEDESFRRDLLAAGGAWLPKPFTAFTLAHRVREVLDATG